MAYLLQHLLADSAARQPDRPAVAAGRPVSDLLRTGQAEQPGSPRTPRPRRGAGRSRGDPRRQVGRLRRGHIRGAEGRGMLRPARRECTRLAAVRHHARQWHRRGPGGPWRGASSAAAMADSLPQLRSVIVAGPHWGQEGGGTADAPPPGLAVVNWDAVLAEPDGTVPWGPGD